MIDLRTELGAVVVARDVVRVTGADATTFLQGQLSADLAALQDGASAWSMLLEPTGRMCALLRATRRGDEWGLDADAGFGEVVRERLGRFLLRVTVELTVERQPMVAVRGPGAATVGCPDGAVALDPAWPDVEGIDLLGTGAVPTGVAEASIDDLDALRIAHGVPTMGAEITAETIPGELGEHWVDTAVSFDKGCYTGQELVARIDSRGGQVPKPVRALRSSAPLQPGAEVRLGGEVVGHVTSAAVHPTLGPIALAVVARRVVPGTPQVQVLTADGPVPVEVRSALVEA